MPLWDERQPGEGLKAWAAFTIYRDLPNRERSIDEAWRKAKKRKRGAAPGRWQLWSRAHRWVERVQAYEAHLDDLRRTAREKRLVELAIRRTDFEFNVQDHLEELVGWLRAAVEKHNAAPITDIERIEGKEVVVNESSGEIKVVTTTTRIKGMKTSGLARLTDAYRDAMRQAVVGVRDESGENKPALEPKALLPDFLKEAILKARNKETAHGTDCLNPGKAQHS